jgi:hypothetical protein
VGDHWFPPQIMGINMMSYLTADRVIRIIRDNFTRCPMRADGCVNANDFLWALEESIKQAWQEEMKAAGIDEGDG